MEYCAAHNICYCAIAGRQDLGRHLRQGQELEPGQTDGGCREKAPLHVQRDELLVEPLERELPEVWESSPLEEIYWWSEIVSCTRVGFDIHVQAEWQGSTRRPAV